jgi:hypothetical protein
VNSYKCGRCFRTYVDLQDFGAHPCAGENPMLAAFSGSISLGEYTIDLTKMVEDAIEQQQVRTAVDKLEDGLRNGDL